MPTYPKKNYCTKKVDGKNKKLISLEFLGLSPEYVERKQHTLVGQSTFLSNTGQDIWCTGHME